MEMEKVIKAYTFEQLLALGIEQLTKFKNKELTDEDNITGIEDSLHVHDGDYLEQMIELNKYIYTTASTCFPDRCLWVVGVCPLSRAKFIAEKVKQLGFWYVISDNNRNLLDMYIDETKRSPVQSLYFEHVNNPEICIPFTEDVCAGWILDDNGGGTLKYYPNFHCETSEIQNIYQTQRPNAIETYKYTASDLYQSDDPLVEISIEDPDMDRDTLYAVLIDIFEGKI